MIITQISDTHINLKSPNCDQRLLDFETVIRDINSLAQQLDLIIHSGDVVQNRLMEECAKATRILSEAKPPVYIVAGNKEDRKNIKKSFAMENYLSVSSELI